MISAKIIADSLNETGQRLTTFILVFPRIILAEFNTHRALSRNSASSRAIPFKKGLKMIFENPFIPIDWMKDHSGMQGSKFFQGSFKIWMLRQLWLSARNFAATFAWLLSKAGLTKQICNRIIEPWMWHTVIVTASEWDNFFALRAHYTAEIHMQDLAYKMLREYNRSTAARLKPGEWHIPFGGKFNEDEIWQMVKEKYPMSEYSHGEKDYETVQYKVMIATARCARVSYNNFEGQDDYRKDVQLHDRLANSGHWSPFEHCAKAMSSDQVSKNYFSGNFKGFLQYRKFFENENKCEPRIKPVANNV